MSRHQDQESQRPARKPSRGVVGSYFGVLIVLLAVLAGLARQAEEPMLLSEPPAAGVPSLSSPPDGTPLPTYPPPAGDELPGEPPPSF